MDLRIVCIPNYCIYLMNLYELIIFYLGGVALDVNALVKSYIHKLNGNNADFSMHLFDWKQKKAKEIRDHIEDFFSKLVKARFTDKEMNDAWSFLRAGAVSEPTKIAPHQKVDCVYFYPSERDGAFDWGHLQATSNVVRVVALDMWAQHKDNESKVNWQETLIDLLAGRLVNPSVAGFIDEKIAISIISHVGFKVIAVRPVRPTSLVLDVKVGKVITFEGQWADSSSRPSPVLLDLQQQVMNLSREFKSLQFNPELWNYASADSVVVLYSEAQKAIVEIQVTYEEPSNKRKALKTALFFDSNHWQKFAFVPDDQWSKVILWISSSNKLPKLDNTNIFQAHLSFKDIFDLGKIPYS